MFGDGAIKRRQDLQFIIHLQRMKEQELEEIDRLQGSFSTQTVLGLAVPKVTLPVATGRELAILVEAAVRQYILRQKGYDATERFINRQQEAIQSTGARPTPD
jgi:HPr kinase/phosphorylase